MKKIFILMVLLVLSINGSAIINYVDNSVFMPCGENIRYCGYTINNSLYDVNFFDLRYNYTFLPPYLFLTSRNVSFDETALNSTIDLRNAVTFYNSSIIYVTAGTLNSGTTSNTYIAYDGLKMNFTEAVTTPGLTIIANFTGVSSFTDFIRRGKYTTSTHTMSIGLLDCGTGLYEDEYGTISGQSIFEEAVVNVYDPSNHICGGVVSIRFNEASVGNTNNHYSLDYINLRKGATVLSNIEHDSLSGRSNYDTNHPPYALMINNLNDSLIGNASLLTAINGSVAKWDNPSAVSTAPADNNITMIYSNISYINGVNLAQYNNLTMVYSNLSMNAGINLAEDQNITALSTLMSGKVNKSGDTMTGTLTNPNIIVQNLSFAGGVRLNPYTNLGKQYMLASTDGSGSSNMYIIADDGKSLLFSQGNGSVTSNVNIQTTGGAINIIPNNDGSDYVQLSTTADIPRISAIGASNLEIATDGGNIAMMGGGDTDDYLSFGTPIANYPGINVNGNNFLLVTSDTGPTSVKIYNSTSSSSDSLLFEVNGDTSNIYTTRGGLNLKVSNDVDDYLQYSTVANIPYINVVGGPQVYIKYDASQGKGFYRFYQDSSSADFLIYNDAQTAFTFEQRNTTSATYTGGGVTLLLNNDATGEILIMPNNDASDYWYFQTASDVAKILPLDDGVYDIGDPTHQVHEIWGVYSVVNDTFHNGNKDYLIRDVEKPEGMIRQYIPRDLISSCTETFYPCEQTQKDVLGSSTENNEVTVIGSCRNESLTDCWRRKGDENWNTTKKRLETFDGDIITSDGLSVRNVSIENKALKDALVSKGVISLAEVEAKMPVKEVKP